MGVTITNSRSEKNSNSIFIYTIYMIIMLSLFRNEHLCLKKLLEYKNYFIKHICLPKYTMYYSHEKQSNSFIIILNFQFFCKDHSKRLVVPKRKILRSQSNSINKSWRSKLTKSRHHYTGRTLMVLTGTNRVWWEKKFSWQKWYFVKKNTN